MMDKVYIIGHKNPDTDSICSAIAYANLKNHIDPEHQYIPKRAGHTNPETKYVLKRFGVDKPDFLDTLEPRIKQVSMRTTKGIDEETSLKRAWEQMKEEELRTLPVFNDGKMTGIITQGDIAKAMMEENDRAALSASAVSCKNLLDTLHGTLIVGSEDSIFRNGSIYIGAANTEVMALHITPDAMVIMGNRAAALVSALDQGAKWIIIGLDCELSEEIKSLAKEKGCTIISSPFSTYEIARIINQSMPVRHLMHRKEDIVYFHGNDFIFEAKKVMTKRRIRYFPVLDKHDAFIGMISQRNLLDLDKQEVILVDHNEEGQAIDGVQSAEIIEIIDHHRIGGLQTVSPVYFRNQPLGCTCTIVAHMYEERGVEITPLMASIMCAAILSDTLCFKSPTATALDEKTARKLAAIAGIDPEELAMEMFKAGSDVLDKTDEEIFYQDFKAFSMESNQVGIGQITVIGDEMTETLKTRMLPFISETLNRTHMDMIFFMLTDIMKESSTALFVGDASKVNVKDVVETAFNVEAKENMAILPGIVSRKKQIVPMITNAVQQLL